MKKLKQFAICAASAFMLIGCTNGASSEEPAPSSKTGKSTQTSKQTTSAPAPSSSTPSSSSAKPSSSKTPTSYSGESNAHVAGKDYIIFNKAPEIHFTSNDGSLDWATKPNKDTLTKPEVSGSLWTDKCGSEYYIDHVDATMKVRGNWTTNYEKKPFRIKFAAKNNLFGLNNGNTFKKWVLFADVKDSSLLRNATSFYMARNILNDNIFVSDFTPVHLYLNNQYWGMYLLGEQKETGTKRINVYDKMADNYAGTDIGYAFELDHYANDPSTTDPTFNVEYKPNEITWHHSGENYEESGRGNVTGYTMLSDITNESTQIPFIKNRVEQVYQVLYNAVMNNKLQEIRDNQVVNSTETDMATCLRKTIDLDSFIDMFLLNQIVCDPDVGYSSFYLSIDMSAKGNQLLTLNCPWDYDSALGVRQRAVEDAQGDYVGICSNMWMSLISKAPFFKEALKEKWNTLKAAGFIDNTNAMIDDFVSRYVNDYKQNFNKWPRNMGNNPEVNFETRKEVNNFKTEKEAAQFMKKWLNTRFTWIDNDINEIREPTSAEFKAACTKIRLEAENATLKNGNGGTAIAVKTKTGEGISGNSYVGNLDGNQGASMEFTFNSPKRYDKIYICAGLSARSTTHTFSDFFGITVNGANMDVESHDIVGPTGGQDYHMWTEVDVGYAKSCVSGTNKIVLTSTGTCTNFDYIDVYLPNE